MTETAAEKKERIKKIESQTKEMDTHFTNLRNDLAKESRRFFLQLAITGILFLSFVVPIIYQQIAINKFIFCFSVIMVLYSVIHFFISAKYSLDMNSKDLITKHSFFLRVCDYSKNPEKITPEVYVQVQKHFDKLDKEKDKNDTRALDSCKFLSFQNFALSMLLGGIVLFLGNVIYVIGV